MCYFYYISDGNWAAWEAWGDCSVTCGNVTGLATRNRTCSKPYYKGTPICPAEGNASDVGPCTPPPCPVDGEWTTWSSWGNCSLTCNGGTQTRQRTCETQLYGGVQDCSAVGDIQNQSQACNTQACVDGTWGTWSSWTTCTVLCDGGTQNRSRTCGTADVGMTQICSPAQSVDEASQVCNTVACVNGTWTSWTSWSTCSKVCNTGTQNRTRTCGAPGAGGSQICPTAGDTDFLNQTCNSNTCVVTGFTINSQGSGSLLNLLAAGMSFSASLCAVPQPAGACCSSGDLVSSNNAAFTTNGQTAITAGSCANLPVANLSVTSVSVTQAFSGIPLAPYVTSIFYVNFQDGSFQACSDGGSQISISKQTINLTCP